MELHVYADQFFLIFGLHVHVLRVKAQCEPAVAVTLQLCKLCETFLIFIIPPPCSFTHYVCVCCEACLKLALRV